MPSTPHHARHWIAGEWEDSSELAESFDPATGEKIGSYTEANAEQAKRAISAALSAFNETGWREDRRLLAKALNEMADRFETRADDLIDILSWRTER